MTIEDIVTTAPPPTETVDLNEFEHHLHGLDIPSENYQELLEIIWSIMVQFAALGFGADTASQAIQAQILSAAEGRNLSPLQSAFSQTTTNKKEASS